MESQRRTSRALDLRKDGYVRVGVQSIKVSVSSLNVLCLSTVSHVAQVGLELTG